MKIKRRLEIGNEGRGLSEITSEKCDCVIKIPMPGKAESRNASVAAAVMVLRSPYPG